MAAPAMTEPFADRPRRVTLCVDKGSDAEDFANELRAMSVTPHMAQNTGGRRSAVGKRIAEASGRIRTIAGREKTRFRGVGRVRLAFTFAAAAYDLVRLPELPAALP